jgi:hypothetical protein
MVDYTFGKEEVDLYAMEYIYVRWIALECATHQNRMQLVPMLSTPDFCGGRIVGVYGVPFVRYKASSDFSFFITEKWCQKGTFRIRCATYTPQSHALPF